MPRTSRLPRLCGAVVLAVAAVGAGMTEADAAEVPGAVTAVRLDETAAQTWSQMRLHLDWRVPDGTAAGDTFSLQLPAQLAATDGMTFPLKDAGGSVVANARVVGQVVTFTMTDYAQTHTGVLGSAWFWVRFSSVVEPGDDLDLVFRVGSTTFTDTIAVTDPGPISGSAAIKWQKWLTDASGNRLDRFLWAIDGPAVTDTLVGSTYQIVDTPGAGQELDCERMTVWSGTRAGGQWADPQWVSRDRWNLECSPSQASVTIKPRANEVGRLFRLLGESRATDTTLSEYRNSGFVRLWGTAELPVSEVIHAGGGGEGTGQNTPAPTTPAPTDTEPGAPVPTSPAPTTPVPTVTVTAPGSTTTIVTGSPVDVNVNVTVPPGPTVTVVPGSPAPTPTTTTATTTTPATASGTTAPTATVTLPGSTPTTPTRATTPATTPGTTTTVTVAPAARPAPVTAPGSVTPASPTRIDTGVPEQGVDPRLAGAGGALALISGIGLLAVSRRRVGD